MRFYAGDAQATDDVVALSDVEAQHLTRVLRLGPGDALRVFNGRGGEFEAVVEHVARNGVWIRVGRAVAAAPEPRVAITLAQAVLKGDKMDDVVRDAVMIGAAAIQPLLTARTEVSHAALDRGRRRERWERIAIASAKQCGRAVVPPILEPLAVDALCAAIADMRRPSPGLMLVEPGASSEAAPLRELDGHAPTETTLLIGPEGGWTADEIAAGASTCRLVTMGGRTIRADAMAAIAVAALFARWEEF